MSKLGSRLTDELKAKIAELSKSNKTAPEIAKELGVKVHQVYNYLRGKLGKKRGIRTIARTTIEEIQSELTKARKTVSKLEKLLKATVLKEEKKFIKIKAKLNLK